MPDQQQPDKVEKRILFGITDLKSFKPQRNGIEQFLIADTNSHQGGIYGTNVTTHRISARTLAHLRTWINHRLKKIQELQNAEKSQINHSTCEAIVDS
jgi:hypothetical protein